MADNYFSRIASKYKGVGIDEVLIIKGESLSVASLQLLRRFFSGAYFTSYYWDSYENMPRNAREKVGYFDRALSFDLHDCSRDSRLEYRPLFFHPEYGAIQGSVGEIDLLFLGTVHGDRYKVVEKVASRLPESVNFERILYSPSKSVWFIQRYFGGRYRGSSVSDFVFEPVSFSGVLDLIKRSNAVLDIQRAVQSGYTMRTLEMFGARRKLITTNHEISSADFFSSLNHLVIDRNDPKIESEFLFGGWDASRDELRSYYSLNGWLDSVFNGRL